LAILDLPKKLQNKFNVFERLLINKKMNKIKGLPEGVDGIEMAIKIGNTPPLDYDDGTTKSDFTGDSAAIKIGPEVIGKYAYIFTCYFKNGNPRIYYKPSALQSTLLVMDGIYNKAPNAAKCS
jgi:hypothetical protein